MVFQKQTKTVSSVSFVGSVAPFLKSVASMASLAK